MAAEAWRVRFQERVVEAASRMERVQGHPAAAQGHLALAAPLLADNAAASAARDRIQRVLGALGEASSDLAFAMSVMNGAKLLVFSDFPEGNAGVVLHDAVEDVEEAFAMVDSCCSHLDAVLLLLDHPRLPGVDGLIQEELAAADGDLQATIGNAELGTELAVGARQDVSRAN
uniref:DOG1 domain-containing protein n=1 Tax=Oryza meridionalis TaxID=40149 RepID=A0A0E0BXD4_9ORYZ